MGCSSEKIFQNSKPYTQNRRLPEECMILDTSLPDIFTCPVRHDLEANNLRLIFIVIICSYVDVELLFLERDLDYLRPEN